MLSATHFPAGPVCGHAEQTAMIQQMLPTARPGGEDIRSLHQASNVLHGLERPVTLWLLLGDQLGSKICWGAGEGLWAQGGGAWVWLCCSK